MKALPEEARDMLLILALFTLATLVLPYITGGVTP